MDPEGWNWSTGEELLAALVELVDHGNRLLFAVNKKKGQRMPNPVQVIRPGQTAEEKKPRKVTHDHDEIVAFFSRGRV